MPRSPRVILPGVPVHITQRGNDRIRTFHADEDFIEYRDILAEIARDSGCAIHAWVLMPNHIHLLLTPADAGAASTLMRRVGVRYVRRVNVRYGRTGTLWEGRFRSMVIATERYFLTCARYIELNPVRGGLVGEPASYRWSSHRHHVTGAPDPVVSPHPLYVRLGATAEARREAWRALCTEALDEDVLHEIRSAIRAPRTRIGAREGTEFALATDRLGNLPPRFRLAGP